ncbi:MAG TPA: hypothetical protein VG500_18075 [Gemmatimonadales bacterium]|jgi:hypothetical protein|nr:hypothetical protein [Gemmatimonadales bacterium]
MRCVRFAGGLALALVACGGDGNGGTDPEFDITGTFIGEYTASLTPGEVYQETLQLAQNGSDITGTLVTTNGRTGTVSGSVSGTRLTATVELTDICGGTSETTADITNDGSRLVGTYEADDCLGTYTGTFDLEKQ